MCRPLFACAQYAGARRYLACAQYAPRYGHAFVLRNAIGFIIMRSRQSLAVFSNDVTEFFVEDRVCCDDVAVV